MDERSGGEDETELKSLDAYLMNCGIGLSQVPNLANSSSFGRSINQKKFKGNLGFLANKVNSVRS